MKFARHEWVFAVTILAIIIIVVAASALYGQRGINQRLRGWEPLSDDYTYVRTVTTSGGLECLIVKSKHGSFGGVSCR